MKTLRNYVLAIFSTFFFAQLAYAESSEAPILKVGVIVPLTGEGASWGNSFRNGMLLALEELSPEDRRRVQFIFEDDQLSASKAVSALTKLVTHDHIQAVINLSSGTANALAPIVERQGIVLLAVASDPKIVNGRRFAFNFWVTPEAEAQAMIPEALRRKYKNVVRLTTIHEGAFAVRNAMDAVNQGRIKFGIDEEYAPDNKDFRTVLAKIKARKDFDAIHPILFPGQLSTFTKQARSMGIELPFFGWEFFEDANEVKNSAGTMIGAWYVNADDSRGDFDQRYLKMFPGASLYTAANGNDAVLLFIAAAKKNPSSDGAREFLAQLKDFQGALGTYSSSGDNRFTLPAAVKEVTADGFKKLS